MKKYNGNEKSRIDELFERKLRQHTYPPAPDSWARVQAQTGGKRRRGFLWWLLLLALLLAVGGVSTWYAGFKPTNTSVETVRQRSVETHSEADKPRENATAKPPATEEELATSRQEEADKETLTSTSVTKPEPRRTAQNQRPDPKNISPDPVAEPTEKPQADKTTDSLIAAPVLSLPAADSLSSLAEENTPAPPQPDTLESTERYTEIEIEFHLGSAPGSRAEEQQDTQRVPSTAERVLRNLWHLKQGDGKADINELLPNKKSKKK